jgi:hypothetical protein
MSYPGYLTNSTNVPADVSTQRSVGTFSFQLNTGEASNESTLQSPASVTKDSNGNVSLTMAATPVVGSSTLTMSGASPSINMNSQGGQSLLTVGGSSGAIVVNSNQDATLSLITNSTATVATSSTLILGSTSAQATNDIIFGNPGTDGISLYQASARPGQLSIGNNFTLQNIASFNQLTNTSEIGNPLTIGQTYLNTRTTFTNNASRPPASGLVVENTSATTSSITGQNTVNGVISIGSSLAFPNTLQVSDVAPFAGVANFVQINGGENLVPLFLSGAQGGGGQCGIHPLTVPGAGELLLGADNTNTSNIILSSTATTLNNLGGAPVVLLAASNIGANSNTSFPNPPTEGLWAIMGCSVPVSTAQTRQGQVNTLAYVNSSRNIQMGGAGYADVGGAGGSDGVYIFPLDGTTNSSLVNSGAQQLNNFSIMAFKISGPISNAF